MKLDDLLDVTMLHWHLDQGNIKAQKHPTEPLWILNYTARCQFERQWDDVTRQCRGLIIRDCQLGVFGGCEIIARPFPKFFNYGEHEEGSLDLTSECVVLDKLDGSLGILYPTSEGLAIATRGSFVSDQAIEGTKILREKYGGWNPPVSDYTYLFEIIYPENRIVVHYPNVWDLVGLAVIRTEDGLIREPTKLWWPGPRAEPAPARTLAEALALEPRENAEGLVVRYVYNNLMVKIKQDDYVELHRLITGLNEKVIWARLAAGETADDICVQIPEEFHDFVYEVADDLTGQVATIERVALTAYDDLIRDIVRSDEYRKLFAERATKTSYAGLLFNLLDGKDIEPMIWKGLKPKVTKTLLAVTEDNS